MLGRPIDMFSQADHLQNAGRRSSRKIHGWWRLPATVFSRAVWQPFPEFVPLLRHGTNTGVLSTIGNKALSGLTHGIVPSAVDAAEPPRSAASDGRPIASLQITGVF